MSLHRTATDTREDRPSFWAIAGTVMMALAALSAVLVNLPPHDLWWQMKAGEIIAAEGRIPTQDRFSFTAKGEPWLVQEWLANLVFFSLYRRYGYDSLAYLEFGLMALAVAGMIVAGRLRGASWLLSSACAALAMYALRPWITLRPQLFTYALLALSLVVLEAARRRERPLYLLPLLPLAALWANLHAGALLLPVVMAMETLGAVADRWAARGSSDSEEGEDWQWPGQLAFATVGVLLMTLLTPHGFSLWTYPLKVTGHPVVTGFITEWLSPDFHASGLRPLMVFMTLLSVVLLARGLRPPFRDFLLLGLLFWMGMMYKRNLPLFVLAACPVMAGRIWNAVEGLGEEKLRSVWAGVAACLVALPLVAGMAIRWPQTSLFSAQAGLYDFPEGAVKYLEQHPGGGPLLNQYRWGGYLIWRIPQWPVFIDGRAEVYYSRGVFDDYYLVAKLLPGWREVLEKHHIRTILVERTMPVAEALRGHPDWRVAYEDAQAVILQRTTGPS